MLLNLPAAADAAGFAAHFNDGVWQQAAAVVCARHALPRAGLRRSEQGENIIFFAGERFVVKIFGPHRDNYAREKAGLEFVDGRLGIATPSILHAGEIEGWPYLVITRLVGLSARDVWHEVGTSERVRIVSQLGGALKRLHAYDAPLSESALNRDWRGFVERQAGECVARQRSCGANPEWLASLPGFLSQRLALLPSSYKPAMLHGDVHLGNLLLARKGDRWEAVGLFDFGDSLCGFSEYDFVAPGVLVVQGSCELQRALLLSYGYEESQLDAMLRARLMLLTALYECSDLRKYALRLRPEAVGYTLEQLERAIWTFADT